VIWGDMGRDVAEEGAGLGVGRVRGEGDGAPAAP